MNRTMLKSKIHAPYDERELDSYEPKVVHVNAHNEIIQVDDAVAELVA
jgi:aspartate 1-decarboxylase